jgi:hypothetical protein
MKMTPRRNRVRLVGYAVPHSNGAGHLAFRSQFPSPCLLAIAISSHRAILIAQAPVIPVLFFFLFYFSTY